MIAGLFQQICARTLHKMFIHFFGDLKTPKGHFEINRPLELVSKEMQTLRFGTLCGKSPGNFIPEDSQSSKTQKLTHNSAPFQLLLVSVASLKTETVLANIGTDYTANCTMGSKPFSSHMSYLK